MYYVMLTHNCDDEDVSDEAQDKDDGEGDGDKEECQPPDHSLALLIHPDFGGVVHVPRDLLNHVQFHHDHLVCRHS